MPDNAASGDPVAVESPSDSGRAMARMPETAYVHIDTSVLMQFRRPDEIPWRDLLGTEAVVLVLCPQVVTELDNQKTSNDPRKQKRAESRTFSGGCAREDSNLHTFWVPEPKPGASAIPPLARERRV